MNISIFRLTDDTICVDGIIFIKSPLGIYRAEREEYQDLNVFRNIIEAFLEAESVEKKLIDKEIFDEYVDSVLTELL